MSLQKIKFREWEFEVDTALTEETYATVEGGFSDGCDCSYCLNYRQQKDEIFPKEIKDLFEKLGIDFHKESECISSFETSDIDAGSDKYYGYGGWFHFVGNILFGKNLNENKDVYDTTPITSKFSIGFRNEKALSFFEKNVPLVQIEFAVEIPWIIGKIVEN